MKNLNKRKYIGVPSNNEIKEEYDYLTSLIKYIKTVEQAVEFSNNYPNIITNYFYLSTITVLFLLALIVENMDWFYLDAVLTLTK